MFRFWPLNWDADVRATTFISRMPARAALISSAVPSEQNSWLATPDGFVNGGTAIVGCGIAVVCEPVVVDLSPVAAGAEPGPAREP